MGVAGRINQFEDDPGTDLETPKPVFKIVEGEGQVYPPIERDVFDELRDKLLHTRRTTHHERVMACLDTAYSVAVGSRELPLDPDMMPRLPGNLSAWVEEREGSINRMHREDRGDPYCTANDLFADTASVADQPWPHYQAELVRRLPLHREPREAEIGLRLLCAEILEDL